VPTHAAATSISSGTSSRHAFAKPGLGRHGTPMPATHHSTAVTEPTTADPNASQAQNRPQRDEPADPAASRADRNASTRHQAPMAAIRASGAPTTGQSPAPTPQISQIQQARGRSEPIVASLSNGRGSGIGVEGWEGGITLDRLDS
jgi:hypothetical protein